MDYDYTHNDGEYDFSSRLFYYADDIHAVIKLIDDIRLKAVIEQPLDYDYYLRLCMLTLGSIRDSLKKEAQAI